MFTHYLTFFQQKMTNYVEKIQIVNRQELQELKKYMIIYNQLINIVKNIKKEYRLKRLLKMLVF